MTNLSFCLSWIYFEQSFAAGRKTTTHGTTQLPDTIIPVLKSGPNTNTLMILGVWLALYSFGQLWSCNQNFLNLPSGLLSFPVPIKQCSHFSHTEALFLLLIPCAATISRQVLCFL